MSVAEIQRLSEFEQDIECSICSEPLDQPTVVVDCGHEFCKSCIENWNQGNTTCPTCRGEIKMLIKVPKLDLVVENYLFLLERERQLLEMKQEHIQYKNKIDAISNMVKNKVIDVNEIDTILSSTIITSLKPEEESKVNNAQCKVKEDSDTSSTPTEESSSSSDENNEEEKKIIVRQEIFRPKRNWKEWREMHGNENDFNKRRRMMRRNFYNKDNQNSFHKKKRWDKQRESEGNQFNRKNHDSRRPIGFDMDSKSEGMAEPEGSEINRGKCDGNCGGRCPEHRRHDFVKRNFKDEQNQNYKPDGFKRREHRQRGERKRGYKNYQNNYNQDNFNQNLNSQNNDKQEVIAIEANEDQNNINSKIYGNRPKPDIEENDNERKSDGYRGKQRQHRGDKEYKRHKDYDDHKEYKEHRKFRRGGYDKKDYQ